MADNKWISLVIWGLVFRMVTSDYLVNPHPTKAAPGDVKPRPPKCTYSRAHGMQGADCSGREYTEIPSNLKGSIEILDASYNRIRHIETISQYQDLRFLYLGDNMIMEIQAGTINSLENLEVLDLSVNSLQSIPPFIFDMTNLRKLYLSNNSFRYDLLEEVNFPIKAQLEYIDLAYSMLRIMPAFGIMPDLLHLNLSGNYLSKISMEDIAPLCQLRILDVTGLRRNNINDCECIKLQAYIRMKNVKIIPSDATICNFTYNKESNCPQPAVNETDLELHNECLGKIRVREQQAQQRSVWVGILSGIFVFIAFIGLILYGIHLRNMRNAKRQEKKTGTDTDDMLLKK